MSKRKTKRAVKDEPIFLNKNFFDKLLAKVNQMDWGYKKNREQLILRDKALVSLYILIGIRNREKEQLTKKLFSVNLKRKCIEVAPIQPMKHGQQRSDIILPLTGDLAPFTQIFLEWYNQIPTEESKVFPSANLQGKINWQITLSRYRTWKIIKDTTGLFPHYFRGVCETFMGKIVFKNDAWKLKEYMGLTNLNSTTSYVSGTWTENTKRLQTLKVG